jgi:hypothetical protein
MMRCTFCGARYEAPPGRRFYVCPYCGTALSEGKTYESVYIFKPRTDKTTAFQTVLNLKPTGSPGDLPHQAAPAAAELHFLPLYLYRVSFQPLSGSEADAAALATSKPPVELPRGYRFPTRWKTPFKPSLEKIGVFHQPDLDPESAFYTLGEIVEEAEAYAAVFKTKVTVSWRFEGIAYFPVWAIVYEYGGRKYAAAVDATDGTVIQMEYPLSKRGRAQAAAFAATAALGSAVLGTLTAVLWANPWPVVGTLGGLLASSSAAWRLLKFATAKIGIYKAEAKL